MTMAQEKLGEKSVSGNLVDDPKQVTTPAGKDLTVLRLAENHRRFNRDSQEWEDAGATFYDVAMDNQRLGNNVQQSLSKGDFVRVTGNYSVEPFVTREGEAGLNRRIWANDVAPSLRYSAVEMVPERSQEAERAVQQQGPQMSQEQQVQHEMTPEGERLRREAEQSWAVHQSQQPTGPGHQGPGVS
ncbi:single-stranded DNA-binding protein [Nesterenkonia sp. K-15-9-6]|uniref:single-stranded DNA-binding protein n=1 Tax=Nesterenkonia sp. K-15-9-6 TaxID=3093918 RepID=UPI004044BB63